MGGPVSVLCFHSVDNFSDSFELDYIEIKKEYFMSKKLITVCVLYLMILKGGIVVYAGNCQINVPNKFDRYQVRSLRKTQTKLKNETK